MVSKSMRTITLRVLKKIFRVILGLLLLFGLLVFVFWITAPDVNHLKTRNPDTTSMMEYRESQVYRRTGKKLRRIQYWAPLKSISPKLIHSVLIAEDDNFYQNEGFDIQGIEEAIKKNVHQGQLVSGGSTITQQLAKNIYLNPGRNPFRKLREAVIAIEINRKLKKSRILELYLNVIEWGQGIYGIEAASRHYYQKSASGLTAEEAVRLASILPNPNRYQPENDRSKRMRNKRRVIAKILIRRSLMTEEEYALLEADLKSAVR
jgi:monofunctional biosynthetic peptidoglycan transglycosylase